MTAIGFSAQLQLPLRKPRRDRYQMVDILSPIATLSPSYTATSPALNNWPLVRARLRTLNRLGVPVRGHGIFSPRRAYLPQWMGGHVRKCALTGGYRDPVRATGRLTQAWLRQIHNACSYTKGLVVCQDVATEAFTPSGYNLMGIIPKMFEVARNADPDTPKFLNELLMMPLKNWSELFSLVDECMADGVAVQIHTDVRNDIAPIVDRLEAIGSQVRDRGLRFHVSEVQIACPPGLEMAIRHAEFHRLLFEAANRVEAECYIVWGDTDLHARLPRSTISTHSSGFYDGATIKPVFRTLLGHPARTPYSGGHRRPCEKCGGDPGCNRCLDQTPNAS